MRLELDKQISQRIAYFLLFSTRSTSPIDSTAKYVNDCEKVKRAILPLLSFDNSYRIVNEGDPR